MGKTPPIHVETQSEREEREERAAAIHEYENYHREMRKKEPTQEEERKQAIERARTHGGRWHHLIKHD
jgi:uncharacterized short protein YbdD (DUF466 family)